MCSQENWGGQDKDILVISAIWNGWGTLNNPKTCTGDEGQNGDRTWNGIKINIRTWVSGSVRHNEVKFVSGFTGKCVYKFGNNNITEIQVTDGTIIDHSNNDFYGYIILD